MTQSLPIEIMEKALTLKNSSRLIYIKLFELGKPSSSADVAQSVGHTRAYVNMRLEQLVELGIVKVESMGKTKFFEVVKK